MQLLRIGLIGAMIMAPALAFQHHDVAWYMRNPAARSRMERICQADSAASEGGLRYECANARRAEAGLRAGGFNRDLDRLDALILRDRLRRGW